MKHFATPPQTVYDLKPDIDKHSTRTREGHPDLKGEHDFWRHYETTKKYSMVRVPGFWNVYSSLAYIAKRRVPGDIVECGVFLGGVAIFSCSVRDQFGMNDKRVWLYDTFAGFSRTAAPNPKDQSGQKQRGASFANFREIVEQNIASAGVRAGSYEVVEGPVEATLREHPLPDQISLLRLDTDLYDSTKCELDVLLPRLSIGGVLIIDDYGGFAGARQATDEALSAFPLLLQRVSPSIRCAIKA